ncbi:hypothetical protein [Acetobacter sp.]|jgi:hypothetical protein|uniref:hypothetical protein n=1 Tax=Acetobacter sp. TaxID=440 RepID=UPI0025B7D563|nr:hypothetical protein [Acetobacter sp.]MCH4090722.1 hypothetical protein [Acetobacter sp.]MCI1300562.1 hypothetical protein [Acetobacter sp.]MCI1316236.1 hypothetical protein [Acetobacter sp.]
MNIIATDGGTNNVTINFGPHEAREARSSALNWAGLQRLPATFTRQGVVFRWFQAREESGRRGGDKGIIESISDKPVNIGFSNDAVKEDMLGGALFKMIYVVDVHGQSIEGAPVYYRITRVEDKFPI